MTLNAAHTVETLLSDKATLEKDAGHLGELVDSLAAKCVLYVDNLNLLRGKMVDMQYEIETAHSIMTRDSANQPQCVEFTEQVLSMEAAIALEGHFGRLKGELQELVEQNDALFDDFNTNTDPSHRKGYSIGKIVTGGSSLASPVEHPPGGSPPANNTARGATCSVGTLPRGSRDRTQATRVGAGSGPGVYISVETTGAADDSNNINMNADAGLFSPAPLAVSTNAGNDEGYRADTPYVRHNPRLSDDSGVVTDARSESPGVGATYSVEYPYLAEEGMAGIIASTHTPTCAPNSTGRPPRSNSPPHRHGNHNHQSQNQSRMSNDVLSLSVSVTPSPAKARTHFSCSPHSLQRSSSSPLRASFSPTQDFGASMNSTSSLNRDTNVTVSSPKDYIIVKESMNLLDKRYQDELFVNTNKITALEEEAKNKQNELEDLKNEAELKAQTHTAQLETLVQDYEGKCSGLYDKIAHYQRVSEGLQEKLQRRSDRESERVCTNSVGNQMDESFVSDYSEMDALAGEDNDVGAVGSNDPPMLEEFDQEGLAGPTQQPISPDLARKSELELDYIRDINNTNNMLSSMESRLQMLLNENGLLRKQQQEQKRLLEEQAERERNQEQEQEQGLFEPDSMAVLVGDESETVWQREPTHYSQAQTSSVHSLQQQRREGVAQTEFHGAADAASSTEELQREWQVLTHSTDTNTDTRIIVLDSATVGSLLHHPMSSTGGAGAGADTTAVVARLQNILSESLDTMTGSNLTTPLGSPHGSHSSSYTTPIETRVLGSTAKGKPPPDNNTVVHVTACDLLLLLDKLYLTHIHDNEVSSPGSHIETGAELHMEVIALNALNAELTSKLAAMEDEFESTKKEMGIVIRTLENGVSGHVSAVKHRSPGVGSHTEVGADGVRYSQYGSIPGTPIAMASVAATAAPAGSVSKGPVAGSPPSLLVQNISSLQDHLQQLMTGKDNILGLVDDYKEIQHRYNMLDTKYNVLSTQMSCIPPSILVAAAEKRVMENKLQHAVDICNARIKAHVSRSEREKSEFNNILRSEAEKTRNLNEKLKENAVTIHQLTVQLKAYQIKEYAQETTCATQTSSGRGNSSNVSGYQSNLGRYYASEAAGPADRAMPMPPVPLRENAVTLPPWLQTDPDAYTRHDEILHLPDRIISSYESEQSLFTKSQEGRLAAPGNVPAGNNGTTDSTAVDRPYSPVVAASVPAGVAPSVRPPPTTSTSTVLPSPTTSSGISFMKTAAHSLPVPSEPNAANTNTDANSNTADSNFPTADDDYDCSTNPQFQAKFGNVLRRVVLRHGFDKMKSPAHATSDATSNPNPNPTSASGSSPAHATSDATSASGSLSASSAIAAGKIDECNGHVTPNVPSRLSHVQPVSYNTGMEVTASATNNEVFGNKDGESGNGSRSGSNSLVVSKVLVAPGIETAGLGTGGVNTTINKYAAPDTDPRIHRYQTHTDECEQTYLV